MSEQCGEEKPSCSGCIKREIQCEYTKVGSPHPSANADTPPGVLESTGGPSSAGSTPSALPIREAPQAVPVDSRPADPIPPDIERRVGHFDLEDMALWHYFIQTTAPTLSSPWKENLVTLALSCDYLVHGMLATGALHRGYVSSDLAVRDRYAYLAFQHVNLAIGPFQQAMSNITAANANQLWVFSTLLMTCTFASYRSLDYLFPFSEHASKEVLSNWILCLRGCVRWVETAVEHLELGPMGFMIAEGRKAETAIADGAFPDPELDQSLSLLTTTVLQSPGIKSTTTVEEMEAYADAIDRLRNMFAAKRRGLNSIMLRATAALWVGRISETFLRLLSEKRPPALIIIAHYSLLMKYCEDCWYMEQRSYYLFEAVKLGLGEHWAPYIEYPHRVLYSRP
jgi:Fungal specific transcription factor domain